jgi:hypothetical protein
LANAHDGQNHELIRRLVVFPAAVTGHVTDHSKSFSRQHLAVVMEEVWWQVRRELTKPRRFLVASQRYMISKDTFQARSELEPVDVIVLARLLDAHALMTMELSDQNSFKMRVYDGKTGSLLWLKSISLDSNLLTQDQIPSLAVGMTQDFIASLPYQGFTTSDSPYDGPVLVKEKTLFVKVDLGAETQAQIGDRVEWIRLKAITMDPLFQGGGRMELLAHGQVTRIEKGIATVEVLSEFSSKAKRDRPSLVRVPEIKIGTLVRVPREANRLAEMYLSEFSGAEFEKTLGHELGPANRKVQEEKRTEQRPLIAALSVVSGLAVILLLAF